MSEISVEARETILVVDDTSTNVEILCALLEDDYSVISAANGPDAIRLATDAPPALILLDVMMPGMDGYEVCRILKQNDLTRDIPVIFITALEQDDDETLGLELGAVDYIIKPFNLAITLLRVNNHLELRRLRAALAQCKAELRAALGQ